MYYRYFNPLWSVCLYIVHYVVTRKCVKCKKKQRRVFTEKQIGAGN